MNVKHKGLVSSLTLVAALALMGWVALPAEAQPGTLFVEGNNVGIGIATPSQELHVLSNDPQVLVESSGSTAERVMFVLKNSGKSRFLIQNTQAGSTWSFDNDGIGSFNFSKVGTGVAEMVLDGNGNMFIQGSLTENSDAFAKENIVPVSSVEILEQVLELPIATWNYSDDGSTVRHLGPMAQDFHRTFGLGKNDKGVATLDTSGVALAAIQGLHEIMEDKDREIAQLREQLEELRKTVEALVSNP